MEQVSKFTPTAAAVGLLLTLVMPAAAADLTPLDIHGALSATAGYSDQYNYLGETKNRLDVFSNEVTVNGTHRFANGLRFGAQVYAYKLDKYRDLTLDFAQLDYAVNEKFGIRIGRSKQALGLFGDTQDIDMVRPFALLPLNVYPKTMRSYGAAYDGAAVYGTLPVANAGTVDYHVYGGLPAPYRSNDPWLQVTTSDAPINIDDVSELGRIVGGSLYWNTPLEGLRVGTSILRSTDAELSGTVRTTAEMNNLAGDIRLLPSLLPPGLWDHAIAGQRSSNKATSVTHGFYSAEFTRGAWQFVAEYDYTQLHLINSLPVLGQSTTNTRMDDMYVMASWQAQPKLQLAAYYAVSAGNVKDRRGHLNVSVPAHRAWQKDATLAARYDLASWWLVKAEVHFLNGTQVLNGELNPNVAQWKADWTYLVLKTTVTF